MFATVAAAIGLAPMVAAVFVDWRIGGKPHRVTLWSLAVMVVALLLLAPISGTAAWQGVAAAIISLAS